MGLDSAGLRWTLLGHLPGTCSEGCLCRCSLGPSLTLIPLRVWPHPGAAAWAGGPAPLPSSSHGAHGKGREPPCWPLQVPLMTRSDLPLSRCFLFPSPPPVLSHPVPRFPSSSPFFSLSPPRLLVSSYPFGPPPPFFSLLLSVHHGPSFLIPSCTLHRLRPLPASSRFVSSAAAGPSASLPSLPPLLLLGPRSASLCRHSDRSAFPPDPSVSAPPPVRRRPFVRSHVFGSFEVKTRFLEFPGKNLVLDQ